MDKIKGIVAAVVGIAVMTILLTLPVMWLWNALMPDIFGLVEIGFWQALGLLLLSGMLFKNSSTNSNK